MEGALVIKGWGGASTFELRQLGEDSTQALPVQVVPKVYLIELPFVALKNMYIEQIDSIKLFNG